MHPRLRHRALRHKTGCGGTKPPPLAPPAPASTPHPRPKTSAIAPPKKENHDGLRAYAFSNLARILFTRKFADKSEVPTYSVHPGVVAGIMIASGGFAIMKIVDIEV